MAEKIGLTAILDLQKWSANVTKYGADVSKMEKASQGFGSKVSKHFDGVGKAVLGASAAIGAASVAAGAAVGAFVVGGISKAADLEAAMSGVAAALNMTAEQVKPLKDLIMDLALDPNLVVNTTEAATAIENLAKNGLTMTQIMDGAARSTVLLANATGADFGMAADIASDTMAIFNINAANMGEAVDGITGVTNASKFTINDYRLALSQAGAVANMVGMEFDDFNTTIAAISPNFASGSDAGTSLKTGLINLIPKSSEAAGAMQELGLMTFNSAKAMQILTQKGFAPASASLNDIVPAMIDAFEAESGLNITTEEGSKAYQKYIDKMGLMKNAFFDANGSMRDMSEISVILHEATKDLSEEQMNEAMATIFGTDAMRAMVGIADSGAVAYRTASEAAKALGISIDEAAKFAEGGITNFEAMELSIAKIDAEEQAATRMKNFRGVLMILQGAIEAVQIMIGDAFLPVLTDLANMANELVSAYGPTITKVFQDFGAALSQLMADIQAGKAPFDAFVTALKSLGVDTGFAAQISAIAVSIGAIGLAAGAVLRPVADFIAQFVEWKDVALVLGAAVTFVVVPAIGAMLAAIAPIAGTLAAAIAAVAALRTAWESDFLGIQTATTSAVDAIQTAFEPLTSAIQTHMQGALREIQAFVTGNQTEFTNLQAIWEGAQTSVQNLWEMITGSVTDALPGFISALEEWSAAATAWIAEAIPQITTGIDAWYTELSGAVAANLPAFRKAMLEYATALVNWIGDKSADGSPKLGEWLGKIVAWIPTGIDTLAAEMLKFATAMVTWIGDKSTDVLPELGKWLGRILAWIPLGVLGLAKGMIQMGVALIGWIAGGDGGGESAVSKVDPEMEKFQTALVAALGEVGEAFMEGVQAFVTEWQTTMSEYVDWNQVGSDIMTTIWGGIEVMKSLLTGTVQSIVTSMVAFFTDTDWGSLGQSAINKVKSGVSGAASALLAAMGKMVTDAAAKFTSYDWAGLGKGVIDGILKGLKANGSAIVDYIVGLGEQALDKIKAFLGIASPSREFMKVGYQIVRGWILGMTQQGSALRFAVEQLGLSVARTAGRAGAQASEAFIEALGRFSSLGDARLDEVKAEFEEVSLLAGQIAGLGASGSLAHTTYAKRSSNLGGVIHAFEAESKLLEQQQNTLEMIRSIESAGGDVQGLMSGFLVGDQFAIDAESQVRLTTGLMKKLNDNLHRSLLMNVKGFTKQAAAVQAVAEQALSGFGDTAREQVGKLTEAVFNPESSMPGSLQGNQEALRQLERFAATLKSVRNELDFMAKQRFSAESIIEAMTGEFDELDDFKRRIAGYDRQIEALQERILETGDSSLLSGLRTLDAHRSAVGNELRQFLVQNKRAEQALEGFGDTARAQVERILSAMFGDDVSYEERLDIMPQFEKALQDLMRIRATLNSQQRESAQDIIDDVHGQLDQLGNFQQRIEAFDGQIADLQDRILETGDQGLLAQLMGKDVMRERATNELRTFLLQTSKLEGLFRNIRSVAGAGETSAGRFLADQIQPIMEAFSKPMREVDRASWIKTAEQRIDMLNRFTDQMRVVEKLQQKIAGAEGFDSLADEFLAMQDMSIPEATRLALMRTVDVYIDQMKAFKNAQRDVGDALSSPFGEMFQSTKLDPLLAKIEDIATSEGERFQLMEQYRQQQEKLVAVSKQKQYLSFLEEQANLLNSVKGLGGDTNQLARLSQIFQGITLGPNASVEDLLTAETRLMQERIRLTEEYLKRQQKILAIEQQQQRVDYVGKQVDMVQKLIDLEDEFGYAAVPLESLFRGLTFGTDMPLDDFLNLSGKLVDALLKTSYLTLGGERLHPTGPIAAAQTSTALSSSLSGRSVSVQFTGPITISNGMDLVQFGQFVDQRINQALN